MVDAALAVRGLEAGYDRDLVLFGVDLELAAGEVLALLGPNGAGKTTLLRALSGLIPIRAGTVMSNGSDLRAVDAATRVARGLVHVPSGRAVFASLSVMDNLLVGCHRFAWDRSMVADRIGAALERFPRLGQRLDQPAGTLSGGEQQMLALAKGLVLSPTVLLIDELSLGLAPAAVRDLLEVVRDLAASGTAVLVVEQSIRLALAVADRAMWLERGVVRATAAADQFLEQVGPLQRARPNPPTQDS